MRRKPVSALLICTLVLGLSGCGKGGGKLVAVEGKVTVEGKLLKKGSVLLSPDAAKGNTSEEVASGVIDAEGNYKLNTRGKEGVMPGWYKVGVEASETPDPKDPYNVTSPVAIRYADFRTGVLGNLVGFWPQAGLS